MYVSNYVDSLNQLGGWKKFWIMSGNYWEPTGWNLQNSFDVIHFVIFLEGEKPSKAFNCNLNFLLIQPS